MGLSDHERLSKFYFGLTRLRGKLVDLQKHLARDERDEHGAVKGLIEKMDEIAGEAIQGSDTNGLMWLIGSNEANYRSLFEQRYGLASITQVDDGKKPENYSLDDFREEEADLIHLAEHLSSGQSETDRHTLVALSLWWTAWDEFEWLLYPLNRYRDRLFSDKVRSLLTSVMGLMANTRLEVVKDRYGFGRDPYDIERALLAKNKVMGLMLAKLSRDTEWEEARTKEFDGKAFWEQLGKMSLTDVSAYLEKAQEAEWKAKGEIPPEEPKPDLLFGPKTRSKKELEDVLATGTYEECVKADEELSSVYSCFWGGWRQRFEKAKPKKAAKTKAKKR